MFIRTLVLGPLETNCYIVGDEGVGVVIDPGDEVDRILEELEEAKLKVKLIIATHGHLDHIGGVWGLKKATGAQFLIHPQELKASAKANKLLEVFFPSPPSIPSPDYLLKDGDEIKIGALYLKVLHTPGHSPGGVCLAGRGFVFSGDTLFKESIGRCDFPGGSLEQLLQSIKTKLLTLPDETEVYPGHGPPTTIEEERRSNPFLV